MLELLVPSEAVADLAHAIGRFDLSERPRLTVDAIIDLQNADVEPDVWKVEAFDRHDDYARVVAAAQRDGRNRVSCIVLGGGAPSDQVEMWLATAASVPGFIGFAIGRTTFWDVLIDWRAGHLSHQSAKIEIARRYRQWVDIFEHARSTAV